MATATHIDELYDLLGEATVLLPVKHAEKRPVDSGWQGTTLEATAEEAYQARLAVGNIGVLLGEPSCGLCAIDIDDDQDIESFLALNPELASTLITRGARGVQIWVRCKPDDKLSRRGLPDYPKQYPISFAPGVRDTKDPANGQMKPSHFGEWRSTGGQSVVWGTHPSGSQYSFYHRATVRHVCFSSIRWPDGLALPWKAEEGEALREKYGNPWHEGERGISMIETYWAGLFAVDHDVIYDKDEERYYLYNEPRGLWEKATDQDIIYLGTDMMLRASRAQNLPILQSNKFRSTSKMSALSSQLKGIVGARNVFKQRRGLIHLRNGMIDLTAVDPEDPQLRLLPFSPEYYSRNQVPVAFDGKAECPTFLNDLLLRGLPQEDVDLLQLWGGLLLLQENIYQRMMILTGTAGGGKSTVLSVFQKIVGQDNCAQLRTEQLLERFEMAAFIGKTVLIGADVPGNFLQQRGAYKLKQLTGGDYFQAEVKSARDLVSLYGNFNVGITCNSRLRVAMDSDAGAWDRRLCIIKYEAPKPEKPIANFADWLIEHEGPGILNWLIEGALHLLWTNKFEMTDRQKSVVTDLLEESDSVRSFLRRRVVAASKTDNVTTDELVEAYNEFCDDRGWDALPVGSLEKALPNLMLEVYRVNKTNNIERADGVEKPTKRRGYTRVKLLPREDDSTIFDGEVE